MSKEIKTKRVIFKGLGPTGNIVYGDQLIEDGAIVDLDVKTADAYIQTMLAYEVIDGDEALIKQKQVHLNKQRREKIIQESLDKEKKETKKKKVGDK